MCMEENAAALRAGVKIALEGCIRVKNMSILYGVCSIARLLVRYRNLKHALGRVPSSVPSSKCRLTSE